MCNDLQACALSVVSEPLPTFPSPLPVRVLEVQTQGPSDPAMCDVEMLMRLKQEKFSLLSPSTLKMPELLGTKMPDDGGGRTHEELVTNSSSKMSNSRPANQRGPARRQCNKERLIAYKKKMNPEFQFQEKSDVAEATAEAAASGDSTDEDLVMPRSAPMRSIILPLPPSSSPPPPPPPPPPPASSPGPGRRRRRETPSGPERFQEAPREPGRAK